MFRWVRYPGFNRIIKDYNPVWRAKSKTQPFDKISYHGLMQQSFKDNNIGRIIACKEGREGINRSRVAFTN